MHAPVFIGKRFKGIIMTYRVILVGNKIIVEDGVTVGWRVTRRVSFVRHV